MANLFWGRTAAMGRGILGLARWMETVITNLSPFSQRDVEGEN